MTLITRIDEIARQIPPLRKIRDKALESFKADEGLYKQIYGVRCIETPDYYVAGIYVNSMYLRSIPGGFEYGVGEVSDVSTKFVEGRLCVYWVQKPQYGGSVKVHEWYSPRVDAERLKDSGNMILRVLRPMLNEIKVGWKNCRAEALNYRLDLDKPEDPQYIP